MKKLILLFTLLPVLTWAFPVATNRLDFDPAQSTGAFDDFLWRWSGFDDQAVEFLFKDVAISNVGFRLAYPQRGKTFLDILPPRTTNSVTVITNEVLDVYTNFYPAIFNRVTDRGATNLTVTLNYSNGVFLSRSVVTNSSRVGSVQNTEQVLPPVVVVVTQSAAVVNTAAYGQFTNQFVQSDNVTVTITNNLEKARLNIRANDLNAINSGLNLFLQSDYSQITFDSTDATILYVFGSGFCAISPVISILNNQSGSTILSQGYDFPSPQTIGPISILATNSGRLSFNILSRGMTNCSSVFASFGSFTSDYSVVSGSWYSITGRVDRFISGSNNTYRLRFSAAALNTNNLYQSVTTNTTGSLPATNVVEFAFPSTQRVSRIYSKTETPYSKVTFSIPRTNIPPDGPYFAEVLTYTGASTTNPTQSRTLAKGQVTIENSIWGITNYAGYTNYPGPWSYLLQDGSRPMTGNLDMGGNAVTNIGTNGLRFSSGAYITPTDVATWNSFISSTSGLNAGTVFGGDVTGTYNNLTLRKNALDNMEFVDFTTAPTGTTSAGRMVWNTSRETVRLGLDADLNLDVGQQLILYARNEETNTLAKGEVVYIAGAQGDNPTIKRASNASEALSARTIGIMAESVAVNNSGSVVTHGTIYGLNTTNFTQGANLYLGVNGTLQTNLPTAPTHGVFIGVVERVSANAGQIYVAIQNYQELEELSDVNVRGVATNDFIIWNGTVWTNYARTNLNSIYLPLAGGTMSGNIAMNDYQITSVAALGFDVTTYIQLDESTFYGPWSFDQQPTIPGYQTTTGAVNAANLTNLSAIAGSGLGVTAGQLVVTNAPGGGTQTAFTNITVDSISINQSTNEFGIKLDYTTNVFNNSRISQQIQFVVQSTGASTPVTTNAIFSSGSGVFNFLSETTSGNPANPTRTKLTNTVYHSGNISTLNYLTVSQGNTNYWRITTAPTNATESGQRGQIAVSSSNVFIYNPDALGTGTGRWIRIQGSISWP